MSTIGLAYLIIFMGFITTFGGLFGVLLLLFEEVTDTGRVPFRYYAMMVGLISGGLGLIGIGQGLRLLLLIIAKALNERHDGSPSAHGHLFVACRALRERLHQLRLDLGRLDKSSSEELP
jgi:hypothetical protein